MFSVEGSWTYGEIKDSDPTILEKDKEIGGLNPVRQTNILVTESAKALGVTSFILSLPFVCQYITPLIKVLQQSTKLLNLRTMPHILNSLH